jgi:hypothetical protein
MKILWILLLLWSPLVKGASETEKEAEILRLRQLLERHYKHETWLGVENTYQDMLRVNKKGMYLTVDDHLKGAMAASSVGEIEETLQRLEKGLIIEESNTLRQWTDTLLRETGPVHLSVDRDQVLQKTEQIFQQEMILAIDFANKTLLEKGSFKGRLPIGFYIYGTMHFEVTPEGMKKNTTEKSEQKNNVSIKKEEVVRQKRKPEKEFTVKSSTFEERGIQDFITVGTGMFHWSKTNLGKSGPSQFLAGTMLVGWQREYFNESFILGINPQVQMAFASKSLTVGFLPYVYTGYRKESFFWTIGGIQQNYMVYTNSVITETGIETQDYNSIEISFGWGGNTRLGWIVNDNYCVFVQGGYGGDGHRWMTNTSVGIQSYM